jgi:ribosomal protein S18 acetylase RimI-like enzyme
MLEGPLTDWVVAAATAELGGWDAPKRYVCTWLYKSLDEVSRRFARRGFEPVRHWWEMECPLDEDVGGVSAGELANVPWDIVPWAPAHSARLRIVHNAAFVDHWGNTPMSVESWQKQMLENPAFRPGLSFVALSGNELVGYAYNEMYPEDWESSGRSEGWIGALGVLRGWRKKGIASALITSSMRAMRNDGLEVAMIGVDSASPTGAQHLYESLGFRTKITATTWQLEVG